MGKHKQPKMHWSAYLWPGFSHLWYRGSWAGLALAVGFTVLLNALLISTFLWTQWISTEVRQGGLVVLVIIWALAWLESRSDWQRFLAERRVVDWQKNELKKGEQNRTVQQKTGRQNRDQDEDESSDGSILVSDHVKPEEALSEDLGDQLFREAQKSYLAGDWIRCEQLLRQLLKLDKRDIESQLLLATMWRHLGRAEESIGILRQLECLEAAAPWSFEIACELHEVACKLEAVKSDNDQSKDVDHPTQSCEPMPRMADNDMIGEGAVADRPNPSEQSSQSTRQSSRAA